MTSLTSSAIDQLMAFKQNPIRGKDDHHMGAVQAKPIRGKDDHNMGIVKQNPIRGKNNHMGADLVSASPASVGSVGSESYSDSFHVPSNDFPYASPVSQ